MGKTPAPDTQRIDGRLHSIHDVHDSEGNVVSTVAKPLKVETHLEDIAQLVAGALIMALPVAQTEEVWNLGSDLSTGRILLIMAVSLVTLAGFIWGLFYGKHISTYPGYFLKRLLLAYGLTFAVALVLLVLFDKAPMDDLALAFRRTVLVAFPAAFAATAVDFMR